MFWLGMIMSALINVTQQSFFNLLASQLKLVEFLWKISERV